MNEQLILAIGDSIKHWERMIKYANSHINDYVFDYENMKNDIKDHWRKPCAICNYCDDEFIECEDCVIGLYSIPCEEDCSVYDKVNLACTWRTWLVYANEMLDLLKNILEKEKEKL